MPWPGIGHLDRALKRRLTAKWPHEARSTFVANLRTTRAEASDHSAVSAMLDQLDAKASGTLTHISMMIAALGITAESSIANHAYERALLYFSICLYLLLAMLCLRVMSAVDIETARSPVDAFAAHLAEELVYRRELYRAANTGASTMTGAMVVLVPLIYLF